MVVRQGVELQIAHRMVKLSPQCAGIVAPVGACLLDMGIKEFFANPWVKLLLDVLTVVLVMALIAGAYVLGTIHADEKWRKFGQEYLQLSEDLSMKQEITEENMRGYPYPVAAFEKEAIYVYVGATRKPFPIVTDRKVKKK
ncbi:hypothetical protein SAMN02745181_3741 [Rubritalea squalenifaciens DSM 18772]|uniref:Uncharacterized protein n=1 Tax=Rubritalea squalenifaciens DSM 18772 TaxID=1123071 RepID=A0A1M6S7C9_9BACT|nr:hypothetical protein SAMN02745181_3741 [Rubritalea squalenifaciens DSM 18772]